MRPLFALLLLAACVPDEEPPVGPTPIAIRGPDAADVEVLGAAADRLWGLPDGQVLVQRGTTLVRIGADGIEEDLANEPGVVNAAGLYQDTLLLLAEHGVFTLDADGLRRSPLEDALVGRDVRQVLGVDDELWVATADGLLRWRAGALTSVTPDGLPTDASRLAPARLPEGDGVFVASVGRLYALVDDGGLVAWEEPTGADSLATDAAGTLWIADDGVLRRRRPDGLWEELATDRSIEAVHARDDATEVWLEFDDAIVRFDGSEFREVTGGAVQELDALGRALFLDGMPQRASLGRPLLVLGQPDGTLDEPTLLTFAPTLPSSVESITAAVDDGAAAPLESPWSLGLNPANYEEGPHRVEVEVTYADLDEPVTASVPFGVGTFEIPTWTEDILPLHRGSCAECHDPGGSARLLATPAQWAEEIDLILSNVEEQLMPLPPNEALSPAQIQQIIAWAASGFPE